MTFIKQLLNFSLSLLVFLAFGTIAGLKVDQAEIAKLQKVAVVGYAFVRDEEALFEPVSLTKIQRKKRTLAEDDPEYVMMLTAGDKVMATLANGTAFSVIPREEVTGNPFYQSSTKDPTKRFNIAWYYPYKYRNIKLKKGNAKKLCTELGVDAVIDINFSYPIVTSSNNLLGVFGKTKRTLAMKGKITMIDKNGRTLISGSVRSERIVESKGIELGNSESSSGSIGLDTEKAEVSDLYPNLLISYMEKLVEELGHE